MSDIDYHTKYIKYKTKYFKLMNNMYGGAEKETKEVVYKCKAKDDPNGCPDVSANHYCDTKLACIPKCFTKADCGDVSDCEGNKCVPNKVGIEVLPVITELDPQVKISSKEAAGKNKSRITAILDLEK